MDRDSLHAWIYSIIGLWIPKYRVCAGHVSPYEYFADIFLNEITKSVAWACRSGSKSFLTGLHCWLKALNSPNWAANILGGSYDQSKKSYKATIKFWEATQDIRSKPVLIQEPLMSETRFKNGAYYTISTASTRSTRGPHQPTLFLDEVDEMDSEVYSAAMMQPQASGGYPACWHIASTYHKVSGLMGEILENAEARNYETYTWCILEVMDGCWNVNCDNCILHKWCEGRLKDAIDQAYEEQLESGIVEELEHPHLGYNSYEDVVKKVTNAQVEAGDRGQRVIQLLDIEADLFCRIPSRIGLTYSEFNAADQVTDMVKVHDPARIPEGLKIGEYVLSTWRHYRSFDFGTNNPWVCLYIAVDNEGRIFIYDELYLRGYTTPQVAGMLLGDRTKYEYNVADIAGLQDRRILLDHGIATVAEQVKVADGIMLVKNTMKKRSDGSYGLYINSACVSTVWEISKGYRYPDTGLSENPKKENDHAMDALKNFVYCYDRYKYGVRQTKGVYK